VPLFGWAVSTIGAVFAGNCVLQDVAGVACVAECCGVSTIGVVIAGNCVLQ